MEYNIELHRRNVFWSEILSIFLFFEMEEGVRDLILRLVAFF